ncbi:MAG: YdiU family protein [Proteobacteria bacterium]|nr:YdiU family protein [Pseudomonadota bacterium]
MSAHIQKSRLDDLKFDNRFVGVLPADPIADNHRRQVTAACYSRVLPQIVARPELVAFSKDAASLLDLSAADCMSSEFAEVFAGNRTLDGMDPYAMCYGGHQFGNWAGQLGDGRAINLGEIINARGERWALQLKGAGPTPYSRTADGLAVLRSSLREFLCSEAMHYLGVPTTRALSLIRTGESVVRDMFYDGRPQAEPGAVVCRLAPSFIRFGNFQLFAARGEIEVLRSLVHYTIETDFPELGPPSKETIVAWFAEVCRRTATMIVHWMRVGFVHGVMNTDNMSILGLTIDYGPYGWLENYDPDWTPNTTDAHGKRYRFGHQPQIGMWNLVQLANAIYPLVEETEPLEQALATYASTYESSWQSMMAAKLGFDRYSGDADLALITELIELLQLVETDMTIFYRRLAEIDSGQQFNADQCMALFANAYYVPDEVSREYVQRVTTWLNRYIERLREDSCDDVSRRAQMNTVNPKYVLRNYLAQLAIDKAEAGDYTLVNELLEVLRTPYEELPNSEAFAGKRPDWARERAGCSMLSCSS